MKLESVSYKEAVGTQATTAHKAPEAEIELHPAGVLVRPKIGAKRILVPFSNVKYAVIADEKKP